jgi:hypothetical protein
MLVVNRYDGQVLDCDPSMPLARCDSNEKHLISHQPKSDTLPRIFHVLVSGVLSWVHVYFRDAVR